MGIVGRGVYKGEGRMNRCVFEISFLWRLGGGGGGVGLLLGGALGVEGVELAAGCQAIWGVLGYRTS